MLKDQTDAANDVRPGSKSGRLAASLALLALTVGVAGWKAPATLAGDEPAARPAAKVAEAAGAVEPFDVRYIPESMKGVVAFRPAAVAKRAGMAGVTAWVRELFADDFAHLAKALGVDTKQTDFRKLAFEDIEWVAVGMATDKFTPPSGSPAKQADPQPTHRLMFSGFTARAVAPFDWAAFLRQWKVELKEVRVGRGVYYEMNAPGDERHELSFGVLLPDDRTIVLDDPKRIRELAGREPLAPPSYLRGQDWDRVSRGILAVMVDNHDDRFARDYDLMRPDDAIVLSLFRGIERWTIGVADRDDIAFRAEATGRDPMAAEALARTIQAQAVLGQVAIGKVKPPAEAAHGPDLEALALRMAGQFLARLTPETAGPSLALRVEGVGTLADVLTLLKADFAKEQAEAGARAEEAKAKAGTEKR